MDGSGVGPSIARSQRRAIRRRLLHIAHRSHGEALDEASRRRALMLIGATRPEIEGKLHTRIDEEADVSSVAAEFAERRATRERAYHDRAASVQADIDAEARRAQERIVYSSVGRAGEMLQSIPPPPSVFKRPSPPPAPKFDPLFFREHMGVAPLTGSILHSAALVARWGTDPPSFTGSGVPPLPSRPIILAFGACGAIEAAAAGIRESGLMGSAVEVVDPAALIKEACRPLDAESLLASRSAAAHSLAVTQRAVRVTMRGGRPVSAEHVARLVLQHIAFKDASRGGVDGAVDAMGASTRGGRGAGGGEGADGRTGAGGGGVGGSDADDAQVVMVVGLPCSVSTVASFEAVSQGYSATARAYCEQRATLIEAIRAREEADGEEDVEGRSGGGKRSEGGLVSVESLKKDLAVLEESQGGPLASLEEWAAACPSNAVEEVGFTLAPRSAVGEEVTVNLTDLTPNPVPLMSHDGPWGQPPSASFWADLTSALRPSSSRPSSTRPITAGSKVPRSSVGLGVQPYALADGGSAVAEGRGMGRGAEGGGDLSGDGGVGGVDTAATSFRSPVLGDSVVGGAATGSILALQDGGAVGQDVFAASASCAAGMFGGTYDSPTPVDTDLATCGLWNASLPVIPSAVARAAVAGGPPSFPAVGVIFLDQMSVPLSGTMAALDVLRKALATSSAARAARKHVPPSAMATPHTVGAVGNQDGNDGGAVGDTSWGAPLVNLDVADLLASLSESERAVMKRLLASEAPVRVACGPIAGATTATSRLVQPIVTAQLPSVHADRIAAHRRRALAVSEVLAAAYGAADSRVCATLPMGEGGSLVKVEMLARGPCITVEVPVSSDSVASDAAHALHEDPNFNSVLKRVLGAARGVTAAVAAALPRALVAAYGPHIASLAASIAVDDYAMVAPEPPGGVAGAGGMGAGLLTRPMTPARLTTPEAGMIHDPNSPSLMPAAGSTAASPISPGPSTPGAVSNAGGTVVAATSAQFCASHEDGSPFGLNLLPASAEFFAPTGRWVDADSFKLRRGISVRLVKVPDAVSVVAPVSRSAADCIAAQWRNFEEVYKDAVTSALSGLTDLKENWLSSHRAHTDESVNAILAEDVSTALCAYVARNTTADASGARGRGRRVGPAAGAGADTNSQLAVQLLIGSGATADALPSVLRALDGMYDGPLPAAQLNSQNRSLSSSPPPTQPLESVGDSFACALNDLVEQFRVLFNEIPDALRSTQTGINEAHALAADVHLLLRRRIARWGDLAARGLASVLERRGWLAEFNAAAAVCFSQLMAAEVHRFHAAKVAAVRWLAFAAPTAPLPLCLLADPMSDTPPQPPQAPEKGAGGASSPAAGASGAGGEGRSPSGHGRSGRNAKVVLRDSGVADGLVVLASSVATKLNEKSNSSKNVPHGAPIAVLATEGAERPLLAPMRPVGLGFDVVEPTADPSARPNARGRRGVGGAVAAVGVAATVVPSQLDRTAAAAAGAKGDPTTSSDHPSSRAAAELAAAYAAAQAAVRTVEPAEEAADPQQASEKRPAKASRGVAGGPSGRDGHGGGGAAAGGGAGSTAKSGGVAKRADRNVLPDAVGTAAVVQQIRTQYTKALAASAIQAERDLALQRLENIFDAASKFVDEYGDAAASAAREDALRRLERRMQQLYAVAKSVAYLFHTAAETSTRIPQRVFVVSEGERPCVVQVDESMFPAPAAAGRDASVAVATGGASVSPSSSSLRPAASPHGDGSRVRPAGVDKLHAPSVHAGAPARFVSMVGPSAPAAAQAPSTWPLAVLCSPPKMLHHVCPFEAPQSVYESIPSQPGQRPVGDPLWSATPKSIHGTLVSKVVAPLRDAKRRATSAAQRGTGALDSRWEDGPAPAHVACLARLLRSMAPTGLLDRAGFLAIILGAAAAAADGALASIVPLSWYTRRVSRKEAAASQAALGGALVGLNVEALAQLQGGSCDEEGRPRFSRGGIACDSTPIVDGASPRFSHVTSPVGDEEEDDDELVYVVDPKRAYAFANKVFDAFARAPAALDEHTSAGGVGGVTALAAGGGPKRGTASSSANPTAPSSANGRTVSPRGTASRGGVEMFFASSYSDDIIAARRDGGGAPAPWVLIDWREVLGALLLWRSVPLPRPARPLQVTIANASADSVDLETAAAEARTNVARTSPMVRGASGRGPQFFTAADSTLAAEVEALRATVQSFTDAGLLSVTAASPLTLSRDNAASPATRGSFAGQPGRLMAAVGGPRARPANLTAQPPVRERMPGIVPDVSFQAAAETADALSRVSFPAHLLFRGPPASNNGSAPPTGSGQSPRAAESAAASPTANPSANGACELVSMTAFAECPLWWAEADDADEVVESPVACVSPGSLDLTLRSRADFGDGSGSLRRDAGSASGLEAGELAHPDLAWGGVPLCRRNAVHLSVKACLFEIHRVDVSTPGIPHELEGMLRPASQALLDGTALPSSAVASIAAPCSWVPSDSACAPCGLVLSAQAEPAPGTAGPQPTEPSRSQHGGGAARGRGGGDADAAAANAKSWKPPVVSPEGTLLPTALPAAAACSAHSVPAVSAPAGEASKGGAEPPAGRFGRRASIAKGGEVDMAPHAPTIVVPVLPLMAMMLRLCPDPQPIRALQKAIGVVSSTFALSPGGVATLSGMHAVGAATLAAGSTTAGFPPHPDGLPWHSVWPHGGRVSGAVGPAAAAAVFTDAQGQPKGDRLKLRDARNRLRGRLLFNHATIYRRQEFPLPPEDLDETQV